MSFSNAFINYSKGFVFGNGKNISAKEFFDSLTPEEQVQFTEFKKQYAGIADEDLETVWDSSIDKWVQKYIDLACGENATRVIDAEADETKFIEAPAPEAEPEVKTKVKKIVKPSGKWSRFVDKFIEDAEITDEDTIAALRGEDVAAYYQNKQHCYVYLACRSKLLSLFKETKQEYYRTKALIKSNKTTLKSLQKNNFFDVRSIVSA